ncbi:MAG: hypothetical protein IJ094_06105 [Bacilli bacterium]|nr:hypothetical protein [Bacilli bacterium]
MKGIMLIGILILNVLFTGCQDVGKYTDKDGNKYDAETSKAIDEIIEKGVAVEDITNVMIYNHMNNTDIEQDTINNNLTVAKTLQEYMDSIAEYRANNDSFKEVYEDARSYIYDAQSTLKQIVEIGKNIEFEDETINDDTEFILKNIENNIVPFFESVDNFIRTENIKYKLQALDYYNDFNKKNKLILE